jgi:hypothetical protein
MPKKVEQDDLDSIASFESEEEVEIPIKKGRPNGRIQLQKENVEAGLTKTGKKKRECTPAMKEHMAKIRVLARARRKELSELNNQKKALKKDAFAIRKLEVMAEIEEHKDRMRNLALRAKLVKPEDMPGAKKRVTKYKKHDPLEDDEVDEKQKSEIEILEEKLLKLRGQSKPKKPIIIEEEEEISEEEEAPKRGREINRGTPAKKPISRNNSIESNCSRSGNPKIKLDHQPDVPDPSSRMKSKNPMEREQVVNGEQEKLRNVMASLFPTGRF